MKTQTLLEGLEKYKFDAAFGGARRDIKRLFPGLHKKAQNSISLLQCNQRNHIVPYVHIGRSYR